MRCTDYLSGRTKFRAAVSAGGVPAFGKWNKRPGQPVVVGGSRRLVERLQVGQKVLLRRGFDRHSDGLKQSVEFNFAHRALRVRERTVSEVFCFQIEQIVQIVSIRRSRLNWLPMS